MYLYISETDLKIRLQHSLQERNQAWKEYVENIGGISNMTKTLLKQQDCMVEFSNKILSKYLNTQIIDIKNIQNNLICCKLSIKTVD